MAQPWRPYRPAMGPLGVRSSQLPPPLSSSSPSCLIGAKAIPRAPSGCPLWAETFSAGARYWGMHGVRYGAPFRGATPKTAPSWIRTGALQAPVDHVRARAGQAPGLPERFSGGRYGALVRGTLCAALGPPALSDTPAPEQQLQAARTIF